MSEAFGPQAARRFTLAARLLGWRPDEFWSATPAELAGALAPIAGPDEPLVRADLERLMERDHG